MASDKTLKILDKLKAKSVFAAEEAYEAGMSQPALSRLARDGEIERLSHGVYLHPESSIDPADIDFAVACKRFGNEALIGGLSALFWHKLINDAPSQVWVVVPPETKTTSRFYRCIRSKHPANVGVKKTKYFKIVSVERALVEAFVYHKKIGLRVIINAARTALRSGQTSELKLYQIAKKLNAVSTYNKHWESFTLQEDI